jgi:rfaE bifunctional protein nucleotidyltransferase chain/domain
MGMGGYVIRVLTIGCFDGLHPGHVAQLEAARKLGDCLSVGLTDDDLVHKEKGENHPFFPYHERKMMLMALRCVDYVFVNLNTKRSIANIQPDIYVKGIEYKTKGLDEEQMCKSIGVKIVYIDSFPVYSSTKLFTGQWLHER